MKEDNAQKDAAVGFLKLVTLGKVREAYAMYVAKNFRHHHPYFKGDAESLAKGMEENFQQFPHKAIEIKHVFEDKEFIIVHLKVQLKPGAADYVIIHIFRFEDGKIAELWGAAEEVPRNSVNTNGIF